MTELNPRQPASVKVTPRTRVRRADEKKKIKKKSRAVDTAALDQARRTDELTAVLRLLERLSQKPEGKALLESLISPDIHRHAAEASKSAVPGISDRESPQRAGEEESGAPASGSGGITESPPPTKEPGTERVGPEPSLKAPAEPPPKPDLAGTESEMPGSPKGTPVEKAENQTDALVAKMEMALGQALEEAIGEADDSEEAGSADREPSLINAIRRRRRAKPEPNWKATGFLVLRLLLISLLVLSLFVSAILIAFNLGRNERRKALRADPAIELRALDPADDYKLERALAALREGDGLAAIPLLSELARREPAINSISYLQAIASLTIGDTAGARKHAEDSIARGELVSDSYALLAQSEPENARTLLEKALMADPTNPNPRIELAHLERRDGSNEGCLKLLRSAKNRLLPVDSHALIDALEVLIQLESLTDDALPNESPGSNRIAKLWGESYLALRRNEPSKARDHLGTLLNEVDINLFRYLINDPAFRLYLSEPEISKFFDL